MNVLIVVATLIWGVPFCCIGLTGAAVIVSPRVRAVVFHQLGAE